MKKEANIAGVFYPEEKNELENEIKKFKLKNDLKYFSRAVIVPHAGFKYSGELAASGIQHLNRKAKNVFIFAPSHFERIFGCVVCNYKSFKTPLGEIEVNLELTKEISKFCDCNTNNYVFEKEHSIEVLLPFIQTFLPNAKIIPVLYGCENFKNLTETIEKFWQNNDNVFVISSDLSHFYPEKESRRLDNYTAKMIEENSIRNFEIEQACGAVGICGLVEFAKNKNFSLIRNGLTNSAAETGNSSRVVGYGSWFLYEGDKNDYLKNYCSDFIIKICKNSILSGLQLGEIELESYDCVFEELGASFVSLELEGILRGCIGSIHAHRPLIQDLIKNSHAAAFSDPRFAPLTLNEYNKIKISVSLLSHPERIIFENEDELLKKLTPAIDGVIICDGNNKGVFLPDVWEQLANPKDFLQELKLKAGLAKDYFSESLEAFKFKTTKISL